MGDRQAAVERARRRLTEAGVLDAEGDLEELVRRFLLPPRQDVAEAEFETAVAERCDRVPLGHITGTAEFGGVTFVVGSGAFVPRRHTTPLLEWACSEAVLPADGRVLDLCAGVGTLGIALSRRRPDAAVTCVEYDGTALQYLRRNIARNAGEPGRVSVETADLSRAGCLAHHDGRTDLVLANPPFVASGIDLLPEYRDHHPPAAIYSDGDGLDMVRSVVAHAESALRATGRLGLEHDHRGGQPEAVRNLLAERGWSDVRTMADSEGAPRLTLARRPGTVPASAPNSRTQDAR